MKELKTASSIQSNAHNICSFVHTYIRTYVYEPDLIEKEFKYKLSPWSGYYKLRKFFVNVCKDIIMRILH